MKLRSFLLICSFLSSHCAWADAIIVPRAMLANTIAEFFVEDQGVRVEMEIGLKGLPAFRNILPNQIYEQLGYGETPFSERQERFFQEDLVIVADDEVLPGIVTAMEVRQRAQRDEITGEPLPVQENAEHVLWVNLFYAFEGRPARLSVKAPSNVAPVDIGFVLYHKGVPVNDFRYLSALQTATLDWGDPWYSSFGARNLRRQYSAPMSGFIYVEPFEVRKEIIVRPKDLQRWLDLGLDERETIPADMQGDIKLKVADFLSAHQPVSIDGEPVVGELDRVHFLERTLRSSRVIDPPEDLDINSAILGVIYTYPISELPETVTMHWDLWDERVNKVPVAAVDEAGPFMQFVEPDWPDLVWQNFLKNPTIPTLSVLEPPPSRAMVMLVSVRWLLAVLAIAALTWLIVRSRGSGNRRQPAIALTVTGAAAFTVFIANNMISISGARGAAVVDGLLHNVYRAFDYREESDIYDVLDRSVSGDLLTKIYLETQRGLVLANQGGARAKVKSVEMRELSTEPQADGDGFIAHTTWVVTGSVGHWGHVHQRINQYQANFEIEPIDGVWKLTAMDVLEEERL